MHFSLPAGSNINIPGFDTMFPDLQVEAISMQMAYSVGFKQKELHKQVTFSMTENPATLTT